MRRQPFTSTVALIIFLVVGHWTGAEAAANISITCPAHQVVLATFGLDFSSGDNRRHVHRYSIPG